MSQFWVEVVEIGCRDGKREEDIRKALDVIDMARAVRFGGAQFEVEKRRKDTGKSSNAGLEGRMSAYLEGSDAGEKSRF